MSDAAVGVTVMLVLIALGLGLLVWIVRLASDLILAFTYFVMGLPFILTILLFVLFPPCLIVFLIGYGLLQLGFGEKREPERSD